MADTFSVKVTDYEAMIERIDPLEPPASWRVEDIVGRLAEYGVIHGLQQDKLEELTEDLNAGKAQMHVRVARGNPPAAEGWTQLRQTGDIVLPGEEICVYQPATPGTTVRGMQFPPPETKAATKTAGLNVHHDKGKGVMRSQKYGRVTFRGDMVQVDPMVRISKDRMQAKLDLVPRTADGRVVTLEDIQLALVNEGIDHGIDQEAIEQALAKASEKQAPVLGVVVARGTPPVDGKDGRLDFKVDVETRIGKTTGDDDRIDYRERNTIHNVKKGDLICRLILPVPDEPGQDVYGKEVHGIPGRDPQMPRLEGITFDEIQLEFVAEISGSLINGTDLLAVTPLVTIEGDVDLETGNIHADEASVTVKGSVKDTFEITTEGGVSIGGEVGDAVIVCGGQLEVTGGIVMKEKGRIEAGGTVSARFLQNATVSTSGDIVIGDSAVNCRLEAGGRVIALQGKGRIIGGMIRAHGGVTAKSIGSEGEVPTEMVVDQHVVFECLRQAIHRFKNDLQEIAKVLGAQLPTAEELTAMPAPKRAAIVTLLKYRKLAEHNVALLTELREPLLAAGRKRTSFVSAAEVLYPGTRITILDRTLEVAHPMQACRVGYDTERDRLRALPLSEGEREVEESKQQALKRQEQQREALERIEAMMTEADGLDLPRGLQTLREMGDGSIRILVADDQPLTRKVLRRLLEKCGYTVFEDPGSTVISSIMQHQIDLVLLDIAFPGGKNGIEILKQIKSTNQLKDLPVIMMTVHKEKTIIKAAAANGANDFIIKPFKAEVVKAKVDKLLGATQGH